MVITSIPFPNVPEYPGVPQLARPVGAAIASVPVLAIGIGTIANVLGGALQQAPRWGIWDQAGNQIGLNTTAKTGSLQAVENALKSLATGSSPAVLSTFGFDFTKEMRVSDFPVEGGSFASYNKVEMPANPVVTLAFAGTESERTTFLAAIDKVAISTQLCTVITPEAVYDNYTIDRYRYQRRAVRGATLLMVEVSLKQVRDVVASFSTAEVSPITNPQNPSATSAVNSGMTQPTPPPTSTLKSLANKLGLN
jgi:hypothetical protein